MMYPTPFPRVFPFLAQDQQWQQGGIYVVFVLQLAAFPYRDLFQLPTIASVSLFFLLFAVLGVRHFAAIWDCWWVLFLVPIQLRKGKDIGY